jgi:arginyl-tRNA synthetase
MKTVIEALLKRALDALPEELVPMASRDVGIEIESTRDAQHGDFASNLAMRLAKVARQNPRTLAQALIGALPADPAIEKVEMAGAGFINFFLKEDAFHREIATILARGHEYGRSNLGKGQSLMVEFVSANPTGPLHVGHGRHAAFGATLANLLAAIGYQVKCEYYINDAGRQMDILMVSTWMRYLEHCGETLPFPTNGYRGDYVHAIAQIVHQRHGRELHRPAAAVLAGLPLDAPAGDKELYIDALIARMRELLGDEACEQVHELSLDTMLADIREDLSAFGVEFDSWASERELGRSGAVAHCLQTLQAG